MPATHFAFGLPRSCTKLLNGLTTIHSLSADVSVRLLTHDLFYNIQIIYVIQTTIQCVCYMEFKNNFLVSENEFKKTSMPIYRDVWEYNKHLSSVLKKLIYIQYHSPCTFGSGFDYVNYLNIIKGYLSETVGTRLHLVS